jgi:hypothetical protein
MRIGVLSTENLIPSEEAGIRRRDEGLRLEEARKALPGEEDKHRAAA